MTLKQLTRSAAFVSAALLPVIGSFTMRLAWNEAGNPLLSAQIVIILEVVFFSFRVNLDDILNLDAYQAVTSQKWVVTTLLTFAPLQRVCIICWQTFHIAQIMAPWWRIHVREAGEDQK